MSRRRPEPLAVRDARNLIAELQIKKPSEIDVELIANHRGLLVERRPLTQEEGRIVHSGGVGVITVSERAYRSAKWRWVIAHELGHFHRHPEIDQYALCTAMDMNAGQGVGRESEANDFAAELLLPEHLFKKRCDRNRPSLKDVRDLAEEFRTSLTATAMRFVYFAPEPCAVVQSTGAVVDWCAWSENFRLGIRRGARLSTKTYAGDLFAGRVVGDYSQQVDGEAWSDSAWAADIDLFEHSIKVSTGSVLTMLWHAAR
jgi:Zn-dependent peptidase ImmA (M78 family)